MLIQYARKSYSLLFDGFFIIKKVILFLGKNSNTAQECKVSLNYTLKANEFFDLIFPPTQNRPLLIHQPFTGVHF